MMKKVGELDYIMIISDVIRRTYGSTFLEYNEDLELAKAILNNLREYLCFDSVDISNQDFKDWREKALLEEFDGLEEDIKKIIKKLDPNNYKIFKKTKSKKKKKL